MHQLLGILQKLIRPGFGHRRFAPVSRTIHWILVRTGWYAHEDWKIEYVQEFLEEYANLRNDIGSDWSADTLLARKEFMKHQDALRNCLDADRLKKEWAVVQAEDRLYLEQARAAND